MTKAGAKGKGHDLLVIYGSITVISFFHYYTSTGYHYFHDIYRRLYYIPIIYAAFIYGTYGSLRASVCISLIYLPHAFWHVPHSDPARTIEKVLEIILYNVIAVVTGVLASREKREQERHRRTALELEKSIQDIRGMEQDLLRAEKLSAIGQLTAGLAHEIRNPLGSIKGAAEILAEDCREGDNKYKMAQILLKEVDRLNGVLTNFLDFARPMPLERSSADLDKELESVVKLVETQARLTGVTIKKGSSSSLPSICLDREKMRQVFLNLLLNAVQALPEGGEIGLELARTVQKGRPFAVITVTDHGAGIKKDDLPNIFNPFFTTKKGGSGLGLAISYKIVQEHGGYITVKSEAGEGSVFAVYLPLGEGGLHGSL